MQMNVRLPDFPSILAMSLHTTDPLFRILLCLEYGMYGTTPMMFRAALVLHA